MPNTAEATKSRRRKRATRGDSRLPLAIGAFVLTAFYLFGCWVVLRNEREQKAIKEGPVSQELGEEVVRWSALHDAVYYREFAEKLIYYRHDPAVLQKMYSLALEKAPSMHETFFSYAVYLVSRNCCEDQVRYLLQETVRRCPTHPRMNRIAATYFLHLQDEQLAIPFIRRALEMDARSAPELFGMMQERNRGVEALVAVTPDDADALLQLAQYLGERNPDEQSTLQQIFQRLAKKKLTAEQRLRFAEVAWKTKQTELARGQVALAAQDPDVKSSALALQVRLLQQEGKQQEAAQIARQVEEQYRHSGNPEQAVRYALEFAVQLQHSNRTASKEQMLRILNDYPSYAPAYYTMGQLARQESKELEIYYLKKARDLAPDNAEYLRVLAARLLESKKIGEAETAYGALLHISGMEREALHGLAECRLASGDKHGAIQLLEQAVQRAATSEKTFRDLGQLYLSVGEYERAARTFLEYAKLTPGKVDGLLLAGDAYMNLGRYPYARDLYRKVLAQEPNNSRAREAIANLEALGYR